jgi:hypothetical protein
LGLWLSHLRAIELARGSDVHLHLIEDDTILAASAQTTFDAILERADDQLPGWDLLFTDVWVPAYSVEMFAALAEKLQHYFQTGAISFIDLKPLRLAATSSLFLNRRSIDKYAALLAGQWEAGAPIDLYLRKLVTQGALTAYLTVPFVTSISPQAGQSDIRGQLDRCRLVEAAYRKAFFQDADWPALQREIQQLTTGCELPLLTDIFLRTLTFRLSDSWVEY